jgi:hypothetical protein
MGVCVVGGGGGPQGLVRSWDFPPQAVLRLESRDPMWLTLGGSTKTLNTQKFHLIKAHAHRDSDPLTAGEIVFPASVCPSIHHQ